MRESNFNPISTVSILCITVVVLLSACSSSGEYQTASAKKNSDILPQDTIAVESNAKIEHSHSSNPCTEALSHAHVYETTEHEHSYNCENTNKIVINGHIHPSTEKYGKHRHVHPNGANEHIHNR